MADLNQITPVSKSDAQNAANNPIIVQLSDGTAVLSSTTGALHVLLQNTDVTVVQPTHDNLNANANIQVGDADVANGNPVPVSDAGGSLTVDGTVTVTDGGGSITVDATQLDIDDLNKDDDEVLIWTNTSPDGTGTDTVPITDAQGHLQVDVLTLPAIGELNGTRVHDYQTDAAVTAGSSVNHDYSAAGGAFLFKQVIFASSGASKIEIQIGEAGSGASKIVGFIPAEGGVKSIILPISISVPDTQEVRVIHTNRSLGLAQDLYSTIIGDQQ